MLRAAATAALHEEVDERFSGPFDTDREAYTAFLLALARAVRPLEAALEAGGVRRFSAGLEQARRSGALERDLDILAVAVPAPTPVPVTRDEARLFGSLYVLERVRVWEGSFW